MTRTRPLTVQEAKDRLLECGDQFDWKSAATPVVQTALTTLFTSLIRRAGNKWASKSGNKKTSPRAAAVAEVKQAVRAEAEAPARASEATPKATVAAAASAVVREHAVELCMDACEAVLDSVKRSRVSRASQNGVHTH